MNIRHELLPSQKQQQTFSLKQQQELKILEMSGNELLSYIEEELESNPLLEQDMCYESGYIQKCEPNFELMMNYVIKEKTLSEEIQEQIRYYRGQIHTDLAMFLSDIINDNGYLLYSNKQLTRYFPQYSIEDIEDTIHILQTFEPLGIFARNLQECLLIQLENSSDEHAHLAILLINDWLQDLAEHKFPFLADALHVSVKEIEESYMLIRTLNPKPGSSYSSTAAYLNPEVYIFCEEKEIHIELLRKTYGLHLNMHTYDTAQKEGDFRSYLKEQKQSAETLMSYINRRNTTILKVTQAIVEWQADYFLHSGKLKPCTMKQIANSIGMHESTVSRCINAKAIIFQEQTIPLKYFFPKTLQEDCTEDILTELKAMISSEDKTCPYSDQKLCNLLQEKGFQISRRTVAKYRDQLKIPAAAKRKIFS